MCMVVGIFIYIVQLECSEGMIMFETFGKSFSTINSNDMCCTKNGINMNY